MNVYIVGNGAVGTYLGDLLRGIGNVVTYAPRDLSTVEPVDAELAIVAVKAYDTESAIVTLGRALKPGGGTAIVCPQNGVGNEEKLAAAFGADAIVACALTVPVGFDRDGRSLPTHEGGIAFAPVGSADAHNWVLATFGATGLGVKAVGDYKSLKWSKLALNVVANASCAILNVLPERLVHFGDVFGMEIRAIREVRTVMTKLGIKPIDLPRYPLRALQGIATLPSPMARALLGNSVAGVLNGAVAEAGRSVGVFTPVNAVYARVLSDIAHMPQLWAKYRERPEALEAEIRAEIARTTPGSRLARARRYF